MKTINAFGKEYEVSNYDLVYFDDNETVAQVTIEREFTARDVDCIISNALEGGISYWAGLDNSTKSWETKPKDICNSEWATIVLLNNGCVKLYDRETLETGDEWTLTMDKLMKGYALNCLHRPHDCDIDEGDATTADCIIQYALFGKVVFG